MLKLILKKKYLLGVIFLLTAVYLFGGNSLIHFPVIFDSAVVNFKQPVTPSVQINNTKIFVEIATSSVAIQKGLSGRPALDRNRGMIFIFDRPDYYRFWMPDMRFPIDIIWINGEEIVVGITKNILPETNMAKPRFYTPKEPARYILEVNAGFADDKNIKIGDKAVFNKVE